MNLYINANTLTDKNIGSIGRMLINVIKEFEEFSEIKITLISDIKIDANILNEFKNINNEIYRNKKNKNFNSFIISYLPWVYKILSQQKDIDLFWEPQNYLLKSFSKFKTVVTIHDVFPLEPIANRNFIKRKLFSYFIKNTLTNTRYIQTPSNFTANRIKFFFNETKKIYTIHHGVETNIFSTRRDDENNINYNYALFLGRISYWKGIDLLLDVAEELHKNTSLKIVLAGALVDDTLKIKIQELEKKGIVKYLGFISDEYKNYLIEKADLFLYPSRYDGFGQPPLEAILKDKNVLMSNIPVLKEVTNNLGFYFQVDNKNDFILTALESLNGNREKNEKMKKYVQQLSWENYTLNFYNNFVKGK